jgi:hypothetical protein
MSAPVDIATIVKRVELLEQSIATILPIVSKLLAAGAGAAATPPKPSAAASAPVAAAAAKKAKKEKPAKDPDAPKKELPEGVKAWNAFVTQTIEDMAQKGWEAFTDLSGKAWAGSKPAEDGTHVFSDTGDKPSRVKGGLVYASLLRARDDPEAAARAKARRETRDAQIATQRSGATASGSEEGASATGDGAATEKPVSKRAQAAKERWAAMSEEERAERKAKMAAGRAAAKAGGAAEAGSAAEE